MGGTSENFEKAMTASAAPKTVAPEPETDEARVRTAWNLINLAKDYIRSDTELYADMEKFLQTPPPVEPTV